MTPSQYRETLSRLGLTQAALARLLGYAKDAPNMWATGRRSIPSPVAVVLGAMDEGRLTTDDVERLAV